MEKERWTVCTEIPTEDRNHRWVYPFENFSPDEPPHVRVRLGSDGYWHAYYQTHGGPLLYFRLPEIPR
jgi:hypothetical protein